MRGGTWKLLTAAVAAGALSLGCAPSVRLERADLARLRATAEVPVVQRISSEPWVDCPGDWGERTWTAPGGGLGIGPRPPPPILLAAHVARAAPLAAPAGTTWEDIQEQRTVSLRRAPPRDPARATADAFLALSRAEAEPVPFSRSTVAVGRRTPIDARFGASPVLVFEATRWVLVGCFFAYQPWFDVRAALVDPASGRVLWRHTCGALYPPGPFAEATPAELEADGKALYASLMDARARECASELFGSFTAR